MIDEKPLPEPVEGNGLAYWLPSTELQATVSEAKPLPEPVEGNCLAYWLPSTELQATVSEAKPLPEPVEGNCLAYWLPSTSPGNGFSLINCVTPKIVKFIPFN